MRGTVRAYVFGAALCLAGAAAAQGVNPKAGTAPAPALDDARAGKNVLNAGPDPRVKPPPGSRDHGAIFGSDDEDEQALASQEQTLENQRNQLLLLEHLFTQKPAGAAAAAPAMMPLNTGSTMRPLQPTPAGSQLDRGKTDEMQRRVDSLRREADTLRQSGK
ncbi:MULTISPECIES: hypothetical protein [Achromobacter]|uniref:Uncharacterized protein n=1 Tax=Achromobacter spanius TaxID=217203 RepID=A0ABY8GP27_9BURK|nr:MULTISPECIES: hypothetical protein [Achromobacter]WAI84243.1 hypothetical protein N8Z00_03970 [Achromobacter spanius]WEX94326.1 hypothetical protein N3Z32_27730 [Achromobacter sp. SS2-2022]WFP06512.1 hypothetical protein P8T11_19530 [Achromobacter spanius]